MSVTPRMTPPSRPTSFASTGNDPYICRCLKQGGNSNTIAIVNGIKAAVSDLVDVPKSLKTKVVFDQSLYVKTAIWNVLQEGGIGLVLTAAMILLFLGSMRGTFSVMLSIPLSCLAAFLALNATGGTINTMVLGGIALVLSRLIDNSVVVLENIFRHLEMGESPEIAAEKGGTEVALAVLAATLTTAIVFFPVVFLYGVSRFLHRTGPLGIGCFPGSFLFRGHERSAAFLRTVYSLRARNRIRGRHCRARTSSDSRTFQSRLRQNLKHL